MWIIQKPKDTLKCLQFFKSCFQRSNCHINNNKKIVNSKLFFWWLVFMFLIILSKIFFLITRRFVWKMGSTFILRATLFARSIFFVKHSFQYFSKYDDIFFNCFMVESMLMDLNCNFLLIVLIANKISYQTTTPSKNSKFSRALIKLSASLFVFASLSQDSYN